MADADKGARYLDAERERRPKMVKPTDLEDAVVALWKSGMPRGDRTGWLSVDEFYSVAPGHLTIVTGWPSSGKSEWVDALLMNLAPRGWLFAVHSPENLPHEQHLGKLLEKFFRKPFPHGPTDRISIEEIRDGLDAIAQHFHFIRPGRVDDSLSLTDIIEASEEFFVADTSEQKHGLLIDPWNELENLRPREMSETDFIGHSLRKLKAWARAHKVHVWIVAHPRKIPRSDDGKLPVPTPDSISDSQHWWNKADVNITVHRDLHADTEAVDIYVQKVRFKHIGKRGRATLKFDKVTGTYAEFLKSVTTGRAPYSD